MLRTISVSVLTLLAPTLAAPFLPHEQHDHPVSSVQPGNSQSRHQQPAARLMASTSRPFEEDLEDFLTQWNNHPNPVNELLPLPPGPAPHAHTLPLHPPLEVAHHSLPPVNHSPSRLPDIRSAPEVLQTSRIAQPKAKDPATKSIKTKERDPVTDKNDWRYGLDGRDGSLMELYTIYAQRTGATRFTAAAKLRDFGTRQIVEDLLSKDPVRQDAAIDRMGRPKLRKNCLRHRLLGDQEEHITKRFAELHGFDLRTARRLLDVRLTEDQAALLKDPNRFKAVALGLVPQPNTEAIGGAAHVRGLKGSTSTEHTGSSASDVGTLHGQKRKSNSDELGRGNGDRGDNGGAAKKQRGPAGQVRLRNWQVYSQSEEVIHPETITKMATAYRSFVGCHYYTANVYLRNYITAQPGEAQELQKELLSEDKEQIGKAVAKIGRPIPHKRGESRFLPTGLKNKVEEIVMRERDMERHIALKYINRNLTAEIAKELQTPDTYSIAVQKLLAKPKYAKSKKGKAPMTR